MFESDAELSTPISNRFSECIHHIHRKDPTPKNDSFTFRHLYMKNTARSSQWQSTQQEVALSRRVLGLCMSLLDVDRENLAWLAATLSLHLHQQHTRHLPAPLSSFTPTSSFLSLLLSEREISRNLSEAVLETPERRYPPKAQHGYNCNLHQVYRRKPAVRRARKVSDRTAAFVWRVTLTALCLIVLPVSSSVCWQQPSHTQAYRFCMPKASAAR